MKPKKLREIEAQEELALRPWLECVDKSQRFFARLCKGSVRWKLVKTSPENCWAGDWLVKGEPHFLVLLNIQPQDGTHFIWCCGNDDSNMELRDMPLERAAEVYHQIEDWMSMKDLMELGLMRG